MTNLISWAFGVCVTVTAMGIFTLYKYIIDELINQYVKQSITSESNLINNLTKHAVWPDLISCDPVLLASHGLCQSASKLVTKQSLILVNIGDR